MTFDELQKILEEKFQIVRLADIARELSVTPQVVSNWKSRNQIPYKYVKVLRLKIKELDYSENNSGKMGNPVIMEYPTQENSEISSTEFIINFYKLLSKDYKLIILTTLFCFSLSIFYSFFYAQPVYRSSAKIIPVSDGKSDNSMSGLASNFGINIPGKNNGLLTPAIYPDIINSKKLLRNLLNRNFITEKYGKSFDLISLISGQLNRKNNWTEEEKISAANTLRKMINISASRKSPIITIYVDAFESKLSADIVAALIEELNNLLKDYSYDRIKEKLKFIEVRILQVGIELKKGEETLKEFREQNRNIAASPALLLKQSRIIRDVEVQTEIFTTLKTEMELAKIEQVEENSIVIVLDESELPLFKESPKPLKNIIFSILAGLFLGVIFIYVRKWINENRKDLVNE